MFLVINSKVFKKILVEGADPIAANEGATVTGMPVNVFNSCFQKQLRCQSNHSWYLNRF